MSQQDFWRVVTRNGKAACALKGAEPRRVYGPCRGKKDAHHFFPKRRIKLQLGRAHPRLDEALADARNGICLCRRHHELVEQPGKAALCPRPFELAYFLADYGLHERQPQQFGMKVDPTQ